MEKLLLSPMDVVEIIGLSKSMVYQLLKDGVIPSVRIGKSIRVRTEALHQWIQSLENGDPKSIDLTGGNDPL